MAFINEYVTQESDIELLDDIYVKHINDRTAEGMVKYRLENTVDTPFYDWTIDRDLNCWFKLWGPIRIYNDNVGMMVTGPQSKFLFFWQNQLYILILEYQWEGSTESIYMKPYNTIWKLIEVREVKGNIHDSSSPLVNNPELNIDLKKAVLVYGRRGIRQFYKANGEANSVRQVANGHVDLIIE